MQMSRGRFAALAAGLAALTVLALFGFSRLTDETAATAETKPAAANAVADPAAGELLADQSAATVDRPRAAVAGPASDAWKNALAASSLRDAEVDGQLNFAADGRLRVDADLLRRFDFFLSLSGERSAAQIRQLLLDSISDEYGPVLAAEAEGWFDRYLGLRAELAGRIQQGDLLDDLIAIEQAQLRWFGEHAEALFGAENAQRALAAERLRLQRDRSLSAADRNALLASLQTELPAAEREQLAQSENAQLATAQTRQFENQNADPAQRFAEREAAFGAEAAARLARLDAERADWARRLADYSRQRDGLLSQTWSNQDAQQRALAELRSRLFNGPELARVESLELIGQLPPSGG